MIKRRNRWIANYACILALLCLFIIGSLVLMNVGVHVYKNIVEHNAENFRLRTSLSYVTTKVRQFDQNGRIEVKEEDGVPMLCLKEELDSGSFTTMIYCYKGNLMELFHEDGLEYKLADGFEIMELDGFDVERTGNRLLLTSKEGDENQSLVLGLKSDGYQQK